ncbi:GNAT family N-acetyltransferase [Deinococcus sonorensis]|uniref:GNAT family N-acetyltransferase n=2 Tax=Deinococcus sonorensis TaxID=309891 RepID=A0AAU7UCC1_9DEIO
MISLEPLHLRHLPLLHRWLQQPHVQAFWDDGDRTLELVEQHYFGPDRAQEAFILSEREQPFGYLQLDPVGPDDPLAAWRADQGETWALDLLIGEADRTGQGLAARSIGTLLGSWPQRHPHCRRLLTDSDVRNGRALRAWQKAGFRPLGPATLDGYEALMMAYDLKQWL